MRERERSVNYPFSFFRTTLQGCWDKARKTDGHWTDFVLFLFLDLGVTFAGSSTMFSMRRGSGKPRVLRAMSRKQEGVEVWTAWRKQRHGRGRWRENSTSYTLHNAHIFTLTSILLLTSHAQSENKSSEKRWREGDKKNHLPCFWDVCSNFTL